MQVGDKHVVVTGAASGIGRALVRRFAEEGARAVTAADLDLEGARAAAEEGAAAGASALGLAVDVGDGAAVADLAARAVAEHGQIDLFCSNAGILVLGGEAVPDAEWDRIWRVNVMAHVFAARAVLPAMLARGHGYLLQTASAAGLLSQIGSAPYSVTKHAALAFAEYLAIEYGDRGIGVSVLCPQAVRTGMTAGSDEGGVAGVDGMLEPEAVAGSVIAGLADERFLILPHPTVRDYVRRKAEDPDRWLTGMRRLRARYVESGPN